LPARPLYTARGPLNTNLGRKAAASIAETKATGGAVGKTAQLGRRINWSGFPADADWRKVDAGTICDGSRIFRVCRV
jgi:hypothetical protein